MALPPTVTKLLRSSAPTLLAALGLAPPLNALASAVASKALEAFVPAAGSSPLAPADIEKAVEANAADPAIVPALRQAEADLKRYEDDNNFRFAELDAKDRESARTFQAASGISDQIFRGGIRIVWVALGGMLVMVVGLLLVVFKGVPLDARNANIAVAVFGLIGTAVGFVNGLAATVVAFYWGSSQGSKEKTEAMTSSIRQLNDEIGKVAERTAQPAPPPVVAEAPPALLPPPEKVAEPEPAPAATVVALKASVLVQAVRRLTAPRRYAEGGVEWALTPQGVSVDGAAPMPSTGDPSTVDRIWKDFGEHCSAAAIRFGIPVELIVATIATESDGDPNAFRPEPSKNSGSYGLMQTMLETAREALKDNSLTGRQLLQPEMAIMAGTAYIAQQRDMTNLDPVMVAAAYNSGHPRLAKNKAGKVYTENRWRLYCYPPDTGAHLNRFVSRFNDAMLLSKAQDWGAGGTPTFVAAFAEAASAEAAPAGAAAGPAAPGATATLTTPAAASKESEAAAAALAAVSGSTPVGMIAQNKALATAIQQKLTEHGYLDPPPDGDFRSVSIWALSEFCKRHALSTDVFDGETVRMLLQPRAPLALPRWSGGWIDRVVDHMGRNGHWFSRFPGCRNIVYLEGANPDGSLNADEHNMFNDLRVVFWFKDDGGIAHKEWEATTEPGAHYTQNPLNVGGAARIKFGQYKAWQVGLHKNEYEALTQAGELSVFRDFNKDGKRTGDNIDTGSNFGINQHHGGDAARTNIGRYSAGCLVGRTIAGHKEFMEIVKQDPRYRANNAYKFVTTILPADEVLRG